MTQISDRKSERVRLEEGAIGWLYSAAGRKTVHVRVESVKQHGLTQMRTWGAHERVAVRRG